ncbi:MAG: TlpA disulfide reductase family protein [Candidatus Rokuibacteriota bacterium]
MLLPFFRWGLAWAKDPFETLQLFRPKHQMMAPDFTVPGLGSSLIRLRDFKGQAIFLNFWATWCPPCREEMRSMERLYRRFRPMGFTILALSIDSRGEEVVRPFVKSLGLSFPVGLDPKATVAGEYRMAGLPTSVLIDRGGAIAAVAVGARDWDSPAAHQVIEKLLRG